VGHRGRPADAASHKYTARGFRYVTLAARSDLLAVYNPQNAEKGITPPRDQNGEVDMREFVQNTRNDGPWDGARHQLDMAEARTEAIAALTADILELGRERAEAIRQATDPDYRLPDTFMAEPEEAPRKRGRPKKIMGSVTEIARDEATA
jgi:hypothetical protein